MNTSLTPGSKLAPVSPPLRAVLFDWGNTLVKFASPTTGEATDFAALGALHAELADWGLEAQPLANLSRSEFLAIYAAVWAELDREIKETLRESTLPHLFAGMLARLLPRPAEEPWLLQCPLVLRMSERADELLARETQAMLGAEEMLESLRSLYSLGVVSNLVSSSPVHQSLEQHGLAKYLSVVVVSAEVGYVKPSPVPFRRALTALGLQPVETLFVGDDPVTDMQGAKQVGMRTVLLRRLVDDCPEADFAVDNLGELGTLVTSL